MRCSDRNLPPARVPRTRHRGLCAGLCATLLACATASAQEHLAPPLRLGAVEPGGVRNSATESWGAFNLELTNLTDADREARVLVSYTDRPDVQYGREVWVPARSTLATWLLVGPAAGGPPPAARDIQVFLYDLSAGQDRLVSPTDPVQSRRGVLYRQREPSTTMLLDQDASDEIVFGQLPQPESPADEAVDLIRTFRANRKLSPVVTVVQPGLLPPTPEAFDGIDHFVIASRRIADDPDGMRALRRWLEQGGKVWVLLDRVEPEVVTPLLGDALDFQLVDRTSLNETPTELPVPGEPVPERQKQHHDRPVEFARVLLPPGERVRHAVNGWPAWFTRPVGRGKVLFTTLGPRGWFRPRTATEPSPYPDFPTLPVPLPTLEVLGDELQPPPDPAAFQEDAFRPLLTADIGYTVVSRLTVGLVLAAVVALTLAVGMGLRRSRRPELLGWVGPAAALGAAGVFLLLGESSRRSAPPTVAVAQVVEAVPGLDEVPVHGLLAVYRPDAGPAALGAERGGLFRFDMTGLEDQTRRLILTDRDAWHWENLALPAGVRLAPFRTTAPTAEPLTAVARFGADGLEGKLTAGPFRNLADAVLDTAEGRKLAVRLGPDGTFAAGSQDVLPAGDFLAGAVLSDRQQRRQALYREALKRPAIQLGEARNVLFAWADPIDLHFQLLPEGRTVGGALLAVPLRLESPPGGERVTIPGPLLPFRRVQDEGQTRPTLKSDARADMHLRFQLPSVVLPFTVEQARLAAKIDAPGRRVTIAGWSGNEQVELHRVESPLDPIRVEITEPRLLRLDGEGGLHLNVELSEPPGAGGRGRRGVPAADPWQIEYLELEVTGRVTRDEVAR